MISCKFDDRLTLTFIQLNQIYLPMIAKLLAKPYGSIWKLKKICETPKKGVGYKFARILYEQYQYENGSSIAWNSHFNGEPCFPHGMKNIFVSGAAKIGKDCVIFQNVTIGSVTLIDSKSFGAPQIGDNVYIGAGAVIVGNVKVGNNVRIGANAVVYKDVPDNTTMVVGEQRTITKEETLHNFYYSQQHGHWAYFKDGRFNKVEDADVLKSLNRNVE